MFERYTEKARRTIFFARYAANKGLAVPDLARSEQIMNEYGIEMLGPSLS
jgi:hypothetical protein